MAHSCDSLGHYVVVFGGFGDGSIQIKRKPCYNDIEIFDTQTHASFILSEEDFEEPCAELKLEMLKTAAFDKAKINFENIAKLRKFKLDPPSARGYHVGFVFGSGLFVHGGIAAQSGSPTMADWHLFDFALFSWINIECIWKPAKGKLQAD